MISEIFEFVEDDPDELLDDSLSPSKLYEEERVIKQITAVFNRLRSVTILHVLAGFTISEVADRLNIKVSEADRAWRQAREILREHI